MSAEALLCLEENIIQDGCLELLFVWNSTILDGHNRYEICTRLQIPFMVKRIYPKNREEAMAWICANQLRSRNVTEEARRYLIGKRCEIEKTISAHNADRTNQYTKKGLRSALEPAFATAASQTRERLSKEYHISLVYDL